MSLEACQQLLIPIQTSQGIFIFLLAGKKVFCNGCKLISYLHELKHQLWHMILLWLENGIGCLYLWKI